VKPKPLRRYQNQPDISDFVVHFVCRYGAENPHVPEHIRKMSAYDRLTSILSEQRILAFPPFGNDVPVICFTECTRSGTQALVGQRYAALGLGFSKTFVFQNGGGPAFYLRGDEWTLVKQLPVALRGRATRLWPGREVEDVTAKDPVLGRVSEWTHEREWRILGTGDPPGFTFTFADVALLVVPRREDYGRIIGGTLESNPRVANSLVDMANRLIYLNQGAWVDDAGIWDKGVS
jgi:hypothetical protein